MPTLNVDFHPCWVNMVRTGNVKGWCFMCADRSIRRRAARSVNPSLKPNANNKSGVKGVSLNCGSYRVRIVWRKNRYYLGRFENKDAAEKEYVRALKWIMDNPDGDFENEFI